MFTPPRSPLRYVLLFLVLPVTCLVAQDDAEGLVWPNKTSYRISDPWIRDHHQSIRQMRPKFLVINFANGIGVRGTDQMDPGTVVDEPLLREKVESFFHLLREGSRFQPKLNPSAEGFLQPELVKVIDLQDQSGHANSRLFPRGSLISSSPGYRTVGYFKLFSQQYAKYWGFVENGRALTLGELLNRGMIHDVIMVANQVDGREPNPPEEVTANILEVAFVAQAYDQQRNPIDGEYVKNGIPFDRQKEDMAQATEHDHNSMPWVGRSMRIYFMNVSRGAGCLLHSLAHDLEFRYNESRIYSPKRPFHGRCCQPIMQPLFRQYAGFDLRQRYGAPYDSLYNLGESIRYEDTDRDGVFDRLVHEKGSIDQYDAVAGNCHYPPGAKFGYDYRPAVAVRSSVETWRKPNSVIRPVDHNTWKYLQDDPKIDGDCGGQFLTFWLQNMPGLDNDCVDENGQPLLNWWPFLYY